MRKGSNFILLYVIIQWSQYHLLRNYSFPIEFYWYTKCIKKKTNNLNLVFNILLDSYLAYASISCL